MAKKSGISTLMGGDSWIWGIYYMLALASITVMGSASSRLAYSDITNDNVMRAHTMDLIIWFFVCICGVQSLTRANIKWVKWGGVLGYIGGTIAMASLRIVGTESRGAYRTLFGVQPVEIAKIGLILLICMLVAAKDEPINLLVTKVRQENRKYWTMLALIGVTAGAIALQNMSSAIIVVLASFVVMFAGEVRGKYLRWTVVATLVAGTLAVAALFGLHELNVSQEAGGHRHHTSLGVLDRANTWEYRIFHGDEVPLWEQSLNDDNMQVLSAHMAIANSNGIGRFAGNSMMRDYLPEAYSDYVYAIIFEEYGIVGAAVIMLLYLLLFWRCYRISLHTTNRTMRLMMIGLPAMIVIQALIHMGVCTDAMFVTGQPLPLVSKGGMSVAGTSACFGILLGISHVIRKEEENRMRNEE